MRYTWFGLIVSALFFAFGCEDRDVDPPFVEILSPVVGDTVLHNQVVVVFEAMDDQGVFQYRIDFSGKLDTNGVAKDSLEHYVKVIEVNGSGPLFTDTLMLPANIRGGIYRILVSCVDNAGNNALNDTILVHLQNSADLVPAVVNIQASLLDTTSLQVVASAIDEQNITHLKFKILGPTVTDTLVYWVLDSAQINGGQFTFNQIFTLDSLNFRGTYSVLLEAWGRYNFSTANTEVVLE